MKEHVSDVGALIHSWIEAFEMQLSEDGKRTRNALPESIKRILADAVALQKKTKELGKLRCSWSRAAKKCRAETARTGRDESARSV